MSSCANGRWRQQPVGERRGTLFDDRAAGFLDHDVDADDFDIVTRQKEKRRRHGRPATPATSTAETVQARPRRDLLLLGCCSLRLRRLLRRDQGLLLLIRNVGLRLFLRGLLLHGFRRSIAHGRYSFVELTHHRNVRFPEGVGLFSRSGWGVASTAVPRPLKVRRGAKPEDAKARSEREAGRAAASQRPPDGLRPVWRARSGNRDARR